VLKVPAVVAELLGVDAAPVALVAAGPGTVPLVPPSATDPLPTYTQPLANPAQLDVPAHTTPGRLYLDNL
jgi:hypothetical protein